MTKAVIFDLDGVLIDSEIISYDVYQEILHQFGYELTREQYARSYSGKTESENVKALIETYHLAWTVETGLENVLRIEDRFLSQGVAQKPGAKELLTYLKAHRLKIALASSSTEERALKILKQHDMVPFFDAFVFGHEVENGKPKPDIFLKACGKIGEKPEDCLVLEDSEAGIQAAYCANIPVICIPDLKTPDQKYLSMAKTVLRTLDEVRFFLAAQCKT